MNLIAHVTVHLTIGNGLWRNEVSWATVVLWADSVMIKHVEWPFNIEEYLNKACQVFDDELGLQCWERVVIADDLRINDLMHEQLHINCSGTNEDEVLTIKTIIKTGIS
jgi:hypothetical protein